MRILTVIFFFCQLLSLTATPLRVGIAGLTHDHVNWILGRPDQGDIQIVGIAESDQALAKKYCERYKLPLSLVFGSLEEMLDKTKPEAVTAFGSIYEHLSVVQACAPRGVHVMVEKPLAFSLEHAKEMESLAQKYKIQLLTNYETTWYATNHKVMELAADGTLGTLRKIVAHDGHEGPKEIGVSPEFFNWLTDPKQNGGGAVIDFGCYGANLITWLTNGKRPKSVIGILQQDKPKVYPNVDDEATIIIEYEGMQGIVQASWNWPFGRKDMEVYGTSGYAISDNRSKLRTRSIGMKTEETEILPERKVPFNDPFSLFVAVIRNQVKLKSYDPSSLENNMLVMEILDAAIRSHKTGKRISLN